MGNTNPIRSLSVRGIREALRVALDGPAPVLAACDFVSCVDWSHAGAADAEVKRLLGELEHLTTEVAEGGLDDAAFLERITRITSAEHAPPLGS